MGLFSFIQKLIGTDKSRKEKRRGYSNDSPMYVDDHHLRDMSSSHGVNDYQNPLNHNSQSPCAYDGQPDHTTAEHFSHSHDHSNDTSSYSADSSWDSGFSSDSGSDSGSSSE